MEMDRRGFFGALAALAVVPVAAKPVQYSHVAYGLRENGTIGFKPVESTCDNAMYALKSDGIWRLDNTGWNRIHDR
jgi:hypothetical protein